MREGGGGRWGTARPSSGPSRARGGAPAWTEMAVLLVRDAEIKQLQARVEKVVAEGRARPMGTSE